MIILQFSCYKLGDPKYRVPKLDPLFISELNIQQGVKQIGIALAIRNTSIHGLKNSIFTHARYTTKIKILYMYNDFLLFYFNL